MRTRCGERLLGMCVVLATSLLARAPASWAQEVNLALGRPISADCDLLPGWEGLTDGVKDSDEAPGCFATANSARFPKHVVVDLGGKCSVSRVVVHNSTNGNTRQITVALSLDAKNYTPLREYIFPAGKYQPLTHRFTPKTARFLRITFVDTWGTGLGGKNILYLREAEAYGKRLESPDSPGEDVWASLAGSNPRRSVPSWAATRRYLVELSRPARLMVVSDQPPEPLIGPDGWISRGLQDVNGRWTLAGVQVKFVGYDGSVSEFQKDYKASLELALPDLLIVAPSSVCGQEFTNALAQILASADEVGCSLLVCIPPPPGDPQNSTKLDQYRKIRRELLVQGAQYGAGLLDVGALLAREGDPAKLVGGKNWSVEAVKIAAGAITRLLDE